ncbi:hypothetical protein [Ornithinibacillus bavariensis]|uniref:Uncharacterized protein n=1 Tax=Ornithinibacillus bavariensis TaxID=545502 RepID=A0A919XA73_9BACI|nr:hypothetical protein [Ornithinibacillus bavariensis]GIO26960.1 hypothetical protein J43TS3_15710 [Ornithinibacillus bavariensis]HAM80032.1 hypothetical protein [Ornithinibacillus sp.]
MQLEEIINKINQSTEELDFGTARRYVENNYELLKNQKHRLNTNAREILSFVSERFESGLQPLSRIEMAAINAINISAKKFNLSGVKLAIKNNPKLLLRHDVLDYLNSDAKILLESMGVIEKM